MPIASGEGKLSALDSPQHFIGGHVKKFRSIALFFSMILLLNSFIAAPSTASIGQGLWEYTTSAELTTLSPDDDSLVRISPDLAYASATLTVGNVNYAYLVQITGASVTDYVRLFPAKEGLKFFKCENSAPRLIWVESISGTKYFRSAAVTDMTLGPTSTYAAAWGEVTDRNPQVICTTSGFAYIAASGTNNTEPFSSRTQIVQVDATSQDWTSTLLPEGAFTGAVTSIGAKLALLSIINCTKVSWPDRTCDVDGYIVNGASLGNAQRLASGARMSELSWIGSIVSDHTGYLSWSSGAAFVDVATEQWTITENPGLRTTQAVDLGGGNLIVAGTDDFSKAIVRTFRSGVWSSIRQLDSLGSKSYGIRLIKLRDTIMATWLEADASNHAIIRSSTYNIVNNTWTPASRITPDGYWASSNFISLQTEGPLSALGVVRLVSKTDASAVTGAVQRFTMFTEPSPVSHIAAESHDQSVVLTWSSPNSDGGAAISEYVVGWQGGSISCLVSPCTVTGLANGQQYLFTVRAKNSIGESDPATLSTAVVPAGVPNSPTITAVSTGNRSATVSFSPPSENGSTIRSYTILWQSGSVSCSTSPCEVRGLTNGLSYRFKMTATNGVGPSALSSEYAATVPYQSPIGPTRLIPKFVSKGRYQISWSGASGNGSPITANRYRIADAKVGKFSKYVSTSLRAGATLVGISKGHSYVVEVEVSNGGKSASRKFTFTATK